MQVSAIRWQHCLWGEHLGGRASRRVVPGKSSRAAQPCVHQPQEQPADPAPMIGTRKIRDMHDRAVLSFETDNPS
jgi:hypothetical protein